MQSYFDLVSDTICAPITAEGRSGVALIRVSGEKSQDIVRKLATLPTKLDSHRIYYTKIEDEKSQIDEVLISYFKKGASFTGDEVFEISCHGNPLLVSQIIHLLLVHGCRMAKPGEFSFRAFYNGKIDLVQAESINELIHSKNTKQASMSLKNLSGDFSVSLQDIESNLLRVTAELEASIDFSEEDIPLLDYDRLSEDLRGALTKVNDYIDSFDPSRSFQTGAKILLLGPTNVGKSSLFNKLCHESRSIVTDIEGTTRDLVTKQLFIGPYPVELIDSAGLRDSTDAVESIGIERSLKQSQSADLIIYLTDIRDMDRFEAPLFLPTEKTLFVANKLDLVKSPQIVNNKPMDTNEVSPIASIKFFVSAHTGEGIDELKEEVIEYLSLKQGQDDNPILLQARHVDHFKSCFQHLEQGISLLNNDESPDIISQELMMALAEIHHILGKKFDDEVLDSLFSQFCIGK